MPARALSDPVERALAAKLAAEMRGFPVVKIVIDGKRFELVFADPGLHGSDYDSVAMKR